MNFENFTLPVLVAITATLVSALLIYCFRAKVGKFFFKGLYTKFKNYLTKRFLKLSQLNKTLDIKPLEIENLKLEVANIKADVARQIRKLPFPFATTRAKGRFVCIHCFILEKRDVLIAPDHKFVKCANCSSQVKTPPWYRDYVNTF